jgi:hypothetical protein
MILGLLPKELGSAFLDILSGIGGPSGLFLQAAYRLAFK